jgi:hypothetical protein
LEQQGRDPASGITSLIEIVPHEVHASGLRGNEFAAGSYVESIKYETKNKLDVLVTGLAPDQTDAEKPLLFGAVCERILLRVIPAFQYSTRFSPSVFPRLKPFWLSMCPSGHVAGAPHPFSNDSGG